MVRKRTTPKTMMITADFSRDEEGGYRVWCPELELSASGSDMEDAMRNLGEAVRDFFEGAGRENTYLN